MITWDIFLSGNTVRRLALSFRDTLVSDELHHVQLLSYLLLALHSHRAPWCSWTSQAPSCLRVFVLAVANAQKAPSRPSGLCWSVTISQSPHPPWTLFPTCFILHSPDQYSSISTYLFVSFVIHLRVYLTHTQHKKSDFVFINNFIPKQVIPWFTLISQ